MKYLKTILLIILLASAFLSLFRIGSIHILDGDTAFYASIAKNMALTGDWMTSRHTLSLPPEVQIVDKPPFLFWMMAAGIKMFGMNELGISFFHSLAAVLTILFTVLLARKFFSDMVAIYSGVILATAAQFFYQSRSPLQDIPLTLFVLMSVYFFVVFDKNKNPICLYLSGASAALAVLTKGPIGLILPCLIILVYLIAEKHAHQFPIQNYLIHLPIAVFVFFAVVSPWYIYEYKLLGEPFANTMFRSTIFRYFHPIDLVGNVYIPGAKPTFQFDFYAYFLVILLTSVPWAGFVYPSLFYSFKERRHFSQLPFIYVAVVIILFSFSLGYKMVRYILPAFPAMAIVIAKAWNDLVESREHSSVMRFGNYLNSFFVLPLLLLASIIIFPAQQSTYQPIIIPMLAILCLGILAGTIIFYRKQYQAAFWTLAGFAFLAYAIMLPLADRYFKIAHPYQDLCAKAVQSASPTGIILQYGGLNTSFTSYYTDNRVFQVPMHAAEDFKPYLEQVRSGKSPSIIVITEEPYNLKNELKKIGKIPKLLYNITCLYIFELK